MGKKLSVLLAILMLMTIVVPSAFAEETKSNDIAILYTNDVHTYVDQPLSYDVLKNIESNLEEQYEHVLLVDGGDHA